MKTAALAALLALALAPHGEETLALTVETGTTVTKTFTSKLDLALTEIELQLTIDGEEQEMEAPDAEMSIVEEDSLTFEDEYLTVEGGRATKLKRKFEDLSDSSEREFTDPEGESSNERIERESALEGHTVVLEWDDEDEEWSASYAEGDEDGDTALLGELEDWADLTDLLPSGAVDVGDEWSIPVSAFSRITDPGGELHFTSEDEEEEDDDEYGEQFDDNLEGEITGTLKSVEDGVATIAISGALSTSIEMEEELPEDAEGAEATRALEFEFTLEGELVWNVEAGHAASLTLSGDIELVVRNTTRQNVGVAVVYVQVQRFAGTHTFEAVIE